MTSQFRLLRSRLFAPYFGVQFSGAANDNLFKFGVTLLLTYEIEPSLFPQSMAGVVIGALFILPFLLFSSLAGQLADKYPKHQLMRFIKNLEIAIMLVAAWAFFHSSALVLLLCVFLMGMHSSLFGPVKYAYLPQTLAPEQLLGANGLIQMSTFIAILLGNTLAGVFLGLHSNGLLYLAISCIVLALVGRLSAQAIIPSESLQKELVLSFNPFRQSSEMIRLLRQQPKLLNDILLISWMWFFCAVYLNLFPILSKDILRANEHMATLLLGLFSVGIGIGSLLCNYLHRFHWPISLIGAIGMGLLSIDLWLTLTPTQSLELMGIHAFIQANNNWRVLIDFLLISVSIGLFIVPLYTQIQRASQQSHIARIIAANNILNALFLIASSLWVSLLLLIGFSVAEIFALLGVLHLLYTLVLLQRKFPSN